MILFVYNGLTSILLSRQWWQVPKETLTQKETNSEMREENGYTCFQLECRETLLAVTSPLPGNGDAGQGHRGMGSSVAQPPPTCLEYLGRWFNLSLTSPRLWARNTTAHHRGWNWFMCVCRNNACPLIKTHTIITHSTIYMYAWNIFYHM